MPYFEEIFQSPCRSTSRYWSNAALPSGLHFALEDVEELDDDELDGDEQDDEELDEEMPLDKVSVS